MSQKRTTFHVSQIDAPPAGPTRDAAAQRVRDQFAAMSPTERVMGELTARPPQPRAPLPLRENTPQPRPMPPTAGQMFMGAGMGAIEALDQPPAGMPEGAPYTSPLRLLSASAAVPSALAARAYDASSRGSVIAEAPVVDPLQPADKQSMFSTAIAQRGGGKGAQALGFVADLFTPDLADFATGGLPFAAMAGGVKRIGQKAWRPALEEIFPTRDNYGKLRGFMKPEQIVATVREHPSATPEMVDSAERYAASLKGKGVRAGEAIDRLSAVKHERGRVLYDMKGVKGKPIAGAPRWVTGPEQEAESLNGYLDLVFDGMAGREFYNESGEAFLRHAGDSPDRAYRVSRATSITSPSTDVAGNTGHAVKGHNQAVAGMPIKTGMFPTAMSKTIKKVYDRTVGNLGPKREPFVRQIAMGGKYADASQMTDRAVHDFWEGEAFRYVNPDGTPQRKGFSTVEHAWMDKMTDAAIARANETKMGGFDNWDAGSLQAAAWTGAKLRAGDIKPGQAARSFADYLKRYYMQTGREVIPGSTADHLVGLKDNPEALDYYVTEMGKALYDAKGRDRIAMDSDMLAGGSFEGPGIFQGEITPGRQVNQMAGIVGKNTDTSKGRAFEKVRRVDPASMALIKANEATYGMLTNQDAIAGTMLDEGALKAERDMFDMALPGGQLQAGAPALSEEGFRRAIAADRSAIIPQPEGVRVLNLGQLAREGSGRRAKLLNASEGDPMSARMSDVRGRASSTQFDRFMREQAVAMGDGTRKGAADVTPGRNMGFYESNPWDTPEGAAGQHYARLILDLPTGEANFNRVAPAYFERVNEIEFYLRDNFGIGLNEARIELRKAVIEKGMDGIRELAIKAGVPLAVLLALAQKYQLVPQQAAGDEGGA